MKPERRKKKVELRLRELRNQMVQAGAPAAARGAAAT